jgi:hypothetical protein
MYEYRRHNEYNDGKMERPDLVCGFFTSFQLRQATLSQKSELTESKFIAFWFNSQIAYCTSTCIAPHLYNLGLKQQRHGSRYFKYPQS